MALGHRDTRVVSKNSSGGPDKVWGLREREEGYWDLTMVLV